jgi:hypothetical protein
VIDLLAWNRSVVIGVSDVDHTRGSASFTERVCVFHIGDVGFLIADPLATHCRGCPLVAKLYAAAL